MFYLLKETFRLRNQFHESHFYFLKTNCCFVFIQSQLEMSEKAIPSTYSSEPTQVSGNSPAVVVCGRKTTAQPIAPVGVPCHDVNEVASSQVLPSSITGMPHANIHKDTEPNEKPASCPSPDNTPSLRTERYSPDSALTATTKISVSKSRDSLSGASRNSERPVADWSTDEPENSRFRKKNAQAKKVRRKRTKLALPITKVSTVRKKG